MLETTLGWQLDTESNIPEVQVLNVQKPIVYRVNYSIQ